MSTYVKIKKGLLEAIRYERGELDATVAVQTSGMSEAALEYAQRRIKVELLRIEPTMPDEAADRWATEAVAMIDWNNEALMHKGLRWIARNIYEKMTCEKPTIR